MKVNSDGDFIWDSNYGSSNKDGCYSIIQTSDSGYVFTGQYNYNDIWALKTDSVGIQKWSRTYGPGIGYNIFETSDQNYLVTGFRGNPNDMYIAKLNSVNGDTIWTCILGGSDMDRGYAICNSYNGGFLVVGLTMSFGAGGYDIYLAEITSGGDTVSTRTYGLGENETGYSICQTPDSGYIICASTNSIGAGLNDVYVLKLDANLDTLWTETYGGTNNDRPNQIICAEDSNYVVIGSTESFGAGSDVYFLKFSEDQPTGIDDLVDISNHISNEFGLSQNYPNPFNPSTRIKFSVPAKSFVTLKIYNTLGQEVATLTNGELRQGTHEVNFNAKGLSSGLYFYKLQAKSFIQVKKMLIVK